MCGRIFSPTSPGGRFFAGMYREADGSVDVRRAVREQLRYGADFVKVMTTGARRRVRTPHLGDHRDQRLEPPRGRHPHAARRNTTPKNEKATATGPTTTNAWRTPNQQRNAHDSDRLAALYEPDAHRSGPRLDRCSLPRIGYRLLRSTTRRSSPPTVVAVTSRTVPR